jgi:hypothetical protein
MATSENKIPVSFGREVLLTVLGSIIGWAICTFVSIGLILLLNLVAGDGKLGQLTIPICAIAWGALYMITCAGLCSTIKNDRTTMPNTFKARVSSLVLGAIGIFLVFKFVGNWPD